MAASRSAPFSLFVLVLASSLSALPGCQYLASLVPPEEPPPGEASGSADADPVSPPPPVSAIAQSDDAGRRWRTSPDIDSVAIHPGVPRYDPVRELVDARHLCQGGRRAVVVIDPGDPQNLRGCVRLPSGMRGLADALNEYTPLHAETDEILYATDQDLLEMPFISMMNLGGTLDPTDRQSAAHLVEYLERGGFLVHGVFPSMEHDLQRHGGWSKGVDYWVEPLPPDHPVFHCYFDLTDLSGAGSTGTSRGFQTLGYYLDDRLIAIGGMPGGTRGTVNLLVYALIREGSLAERYVRGAPAPYAPPR